MSETFIAQEILALEQRGLEILIVSMRQPTDTQTHPIHKEISASVLYLPEFLVREPARVMRAWRNGRRRSGYRAARNQWLKDLRRDVSLPRFRSFFQALVLAHETPANLERVHAHYLHTPASVSRYAAGLLELPWSCSAHARDIWTTPEWDKSEKLDDLDWLVTCTGYGHKHLADLARDPARVDLVYHGLDFARFPPARSGDSAQDGGSDNATVTILSVGRAVEKKGYECLLDALASLPRHLHWRFIHIGFGPLLPKLQSKANALGIGKQVTWMGAQSQKKVIESYRNADLFVLANCVAEDGDMDGLPNVMMEAQCQGLACISTRLSAIPELVEDGVTGVLVPPDESKPLAAAIERLISDPDLRASLGAAGSNRVREKFSHEQGVEQLAEKFGLGKRRARMRA